MKKKKHVVLEHPIVSSIKEAKQLWDYLKEDGIESCVRILQLPLFFPAFMAQRKSYVQGDLGNFKMVEIDVVIPYQTKYHLLTALSRCISLIKCFCKDITSINATRQSVDSYDSDTFSLYTVNFFTKDTIAARISLHGTAYKSQEEYRCVVYGTKGRTIATYPKMKFIVKTETSNETHKLLTEENLNFYYDGKNKYKTAYGCMANYLQVFGSTVIRGSYNSEVFVKEAIEVFCMIKAIKRSAKLSSSVKISHIRKEINISA